MNLVLYAVLILGGIGLLASVVLVIASKLMYVPTDERATQIAEVLPGANCGSCGFAGCADYAAAIAAGKAALNLCVPGGAAVAAKVGDIMGETVETKERMVAVIACRGSYDSTHDKYDYNGIESCAACNMFHSGRSDCPYGCVGFGDCAAACPFGAITVQNGLASVNYNVCTGCGTCVAKCPKKIIKLVPYGMHSIVLCSNHDRGSQTRKACVSGCLGCKKCENICPQGAIKVDDNCAVVDFSKCIGCGQCVSVCPVHSPTLKDMKQA